MNIWSICTKLIDGKEEIVTAGCNLIIADNYHRTLITDEVFAKQIEKLEIIDGELHIKEGATLQSLFELDSNNTELLSAATDSVEIVQPVNLGGE